MGGLTFSIVIDAPSERVFEILADVPNHPSWANPKAKMSMAQTAGSGPGPGATYRSRRSSSGSRSPPTSPWRRTSLPPLRDPLRAAPGGQEGHLVPERLPALPEGHGTRISKHVTSNGNPLIFYLAYPGVRVDQMTSLRNLKRRAESGD